ncbi:DUF4362 domain-containing protein [Actinoplanes sp. LDG1-06]|uniref:DUF4362 domain-containing protein n=1 Tax=Paractinoplanes ovalisporus TaxID=2810368 RepID=A0ABS2AK54_9ACTN|nr:DUF4362 domain-containing protein [Actinoplanes ovalisporus]MBM2620234.1 DUF4362 domain-containing protein [Actinoplanes ovalisporus]
MRRLTGLAPLMTLLTCAACATPSEGSTGEGTPTATPTTTAPLVDPTLGPRPLAGGGPDQPSTTLNPGQGAQDCGTFRLGQGEALPDNAKRCFIDAASAGHRATLTVTWPTVEGDPIQVTYTSGTDGHTEVVTDSRADNFGPKTITTENCQGPKPATQGIDFTTCAPVRK